jgi:hypothetical protein
MAKCWPVIGGGGTLCRVVCHWLRQCWIVAIMCGDAGDVGDALPEFNPVSSLVRIRLGTLYNGWALC